MSSEVISSRRILYSLHKFVFIAEASDSTFAATMCVGMGKLLWMMSRAMQSFQDKSMSWLSLSARIAVILVVLPWNVVLILAKPDVAILSPLAFTRLIVLLEKMERFCFFAIDVFMRVWVDPVSGNAFILKDFGAEWLESFSHKRTVGVDSLLESWTAFEEDFLTLQFFLVCPVLLQFGQGLLCVQHVFGSCLPVEHLKHFCVEFELVAEVCTICVRCAAS